MSGDTIDRTVDRTVSGADSAKLRTAEALEEAARRLREADISARGDEIRSILHDAEDRISQFREDVGEKYHEIEGRYHEQMEPVETIISEHPVPAVMVAMGIGFLFGMLISRSHD